MTLLVLGGDGFVGGAVLRAALARGVQVVAAVQDEPRVALPDAVRVVRLDPVAGGAGAVDDVLADVRPDALVNAAGLTRGDLPHLVAANVLLVACLIEGMRAAEVAPPGARRCRLVHVGSSAEYAPRPWGTPTRVGDPTGPASAYGVTKLAATGLVRAAVASSGTDAVVVRLFNPVGPGAPDATLAGSVAARLRRAIADGRTSLELGDLSAARDFIDVRDAADLMVGAALHDGPLPPVIHAGTGVASTAADLVAGLVAAAGWQGRIHQTGAGSPASPGVDWQVADISTTVAALGWRPARSLAQSLADLWGGRDG